MKKKKTYHNVGTFPISNRKFVELEVKSTSCISIDGSNTYLQLSNLYMYKEFDLQQKLYMVWQLYSL
jgi:hypothetical protein